MEKTYRLEFNEKQQNFHLDNFTHEEGTQLIICWNTDWLSFLNAL